MFKDCHANLDYFFLKYKYITDFLFVPSATFGSKSNLCCRDNIT